MSAVADLAAHRRLVDALRNPACYPDAPGEIQVVETHISTLFLAANRVYKIKKPLDLGFLDFSTLERRRHGCEEEVRLNRRLAPDYYRRTVPITGSPDSPRVDGPGEPIEWAVLMRRFDDHGLLSDRQARGALDTPLIERLADALADFHLGLVGGPPGNLGSAAAVMAPVEENFHQLAPLLTAPGERERLARLRDWSLAAGGALTTLFRQRRADGFVRECHGDLHLGNVALDGDRLVLFDCIEFNPALRWIDLMNEIAFVTMDLRDRGAPAFANRFLNRYLERTGDFAGIRLLAFYEVYRALVRAKVTALRRRQLPAAGEAQREATDHLAHYLELAAALREPPGPALVITHGLSGSGKTFAARALADALGCLHLRSDVERKRLFGLAPDAVSGSVVAGGIYTAEATRRTYGRLAGLARAVLSAGRVALVDAAFLRRDERDSFAGLAREMACPFRILDLSAPEEVLRERVAQRGRVGGDASEATLAVLERQLEFAEPLNRHERAACLAINTAQDGSLAAAIAKLGREPGFAARGPAYQAGQNSEPGAGGNNE